MKIFFPHFFCFPLYRNSVSNMNYKTFIAKDNSTASLLEDVAIMVLVSQLRVLFSYYFEHCFIDLSFVAVVGLGVYVNSLDQYDLGIFLKIILFGFSLWQLPFFGGFFPLYLLWIAGKLLNVPPFRFLMN